MTSSPAPDSTPWLNSDERQLWLRTNAAMMLLPSAVEYQLQRDANMSLFEYYALAMLSESPDRSAQMSQLATLTNGSLSRLSHAVKRMEKHGWVVRKPAPHDKRANVAFLTDEGFAAIKAAAPGHVRHVRSVLFDPLTPEQQNHLHDALGLVLNAIEPSQLSGVDPRALTNPHEPPTS